MNYKFVLIFIFTKFSVALVAQDTLSLKDGSQRIAYIFQKDQEYVYFKYEIGSKNYSKVKLINVVNIAYKNGVANFNEVSEALKNLIKWDSLAKLSAISRKDSLFGYHQQASFRIGVGAVLPLTNIDSSDSLFVNKLAGIFIKAEFDGWFNKNSALSFEAGYFKQNPRLSSLGNLVTKPLANEISQIDFSQNYLFLTVGPKISHSNRFIEMDVKFAMGLAAELGDKQIFVSSADNKYTFSLNRIKSNFNLVFNVQTSIKIHIHKKSRLFGSFGYYFINNSNRYTGTYTNTTTTTTVPPTSTTRTYSFGDVSQVSNLQLLNIIFGIAFDF